MSDVRLFIVGVYDLGLHGVCGKRIEGYTETGGDYMNICKEIETYLKNNFSS